MDMPFNRLVSIPDCCKRSRFRTHSTLVLMTALLGKLCYLLSAHPVDCDAQQLMLGIVTYLSGLYAG